MGKSGKMRIVSKLFNRENRSVRVKIELWSSLTGESKKVAVLEMFVGKGWPQIVLWKNRGFKRSDSRPYELYEVGDLRIIPEPVNLVSGNEPVSLSDYVSWQYDGMQYEGSVMGIHIDTDKNERELLVFCTDGVERFYGRKSKQEVK